MLHNRPLIQGDRGVLWYQIHKSWFVGFLTMMVHYSFMFAWASPHWTAARIHTSIFRTLLSIQINPWWQAALPLMVPITLYSCGSSPSWCHHWTTWSLWFLILKSRKRSWQSSKSAKISELRYCKPVKHHSAAVCVASSRLESVRTRNVCRGWQRAWSHCATAISWCSINAKSKGMFSTEDTISTVWVDS